MLTEPNLPELRKAINDQEWDVAKDIGEYLTKKTPNNPDLLAMTAMAHRNLNHRPAAASYMSRALRLAPGNFNFQCLYIADLLKVDQVGEASRILQLIDESHQQEPQVMLLRSQIHYQLRQFHEASEILLALTQQHPDFGAAHLDLAHVLLMQGKWRAGWQAYQWRFRMPHSRDLLPKLRIPHWDGSSGTKNLLLIADQGYGDCFQFGRYIPLAAERCEQVTLMRSEPLARLLDTVPGIDASYSRWEDVPRASAYSTLSELPRLFDTRPDSIPGCDHLLKVPAKDIRRWKDTVSSHATDAKLRVGVAWTGRAEFGNNFARGVPFTILSNLLDIPGIVFFSLQVGPQSRLADSANLVNLADQLTDFTETAALMSNLDLVITSDTSVAHLAGTLARPTWVLLNYAPDWRWGPGGHASAWYPSARLFRQADNRRWEDVIHTCREALENITRGKQATRALKKFMTQ